MLNQFESGYRSTLPNFIAFTCRFSIRLVSTVGLPSPTFSSPSSVSQSLSVSLTQSVSTFSTLKICFPLESVIEF
uniref:Uncharacterized protein n=1 Tax=Cucumis melo TaxID=3656 RepID=A0A9I9EMY1_CUCME